jgi:hypothetical protein
MPSSADRIRERLVQQGQRQRTRDMGLAIRQIEPGTSDGKALASSPLRRGRGGGRAIAVSSEQGNTAWTATLALTSPVTLGHAAGGEGDSGPGTAAPVILLFDALVDSHAIDEALFAMPTSGVPVPFAGIGSGELYLKFGSPILPGTRVRIVSENGRHIWPHNGQYWLAEYLMLLEPITLSASFDNVQWNQGTIPLVEVTPTDDAAVVVEEGLFTTGMEGPARIQAVAQPDVWVIENQNRGGGTSEFVFNPSAARQLQVGDHVWAVVTQGSTADAITPPTSGWTRYTSNSTPLQNTRMDFWWKELEAGDLLSSWTWTYQSNGYGCEIMCVGGRPPGGVTLSTIVGTQTGGFDNNPISMPSYTSPTALGGLVVGFASGRRSSSSGRVTSMQGTNWQTLRIGTYTGVGITRHPIGEAANLPASAQFAGVIQKKTWRATLPGAAT